MFHFVIVMDWSNSMGFKSMKDWRDSWKGKIDFTISPDNLILGNTCYKLLLTTCLVCFKNRRISLITLISMHMGFIPYVLFRHRLRFKLFASFNTFLASVTNGFYHCDFPFRKHLRIFYQGSIIKGNNFMQP